MQIFYRHTKKMKNNAWEKGIGGIILHSNTSTIRGVRHPVTDLPPATAAATSATDASAVMDELYKSCNFSVTSVSDFSHDIDMI